MLEEQSSLELNERLTNLEKQLNKLTGIVEDIQEQLILIPDLIRYNNLKKFLKEQNFQAADQETTKIMLEVSGKERDKLTPDGLKNYPCNSLLVIDQLWRKYSNEHFGFSVQLKYYYDVGGTIDTIRSQDLKILGKFVDQIGWLNEDKEADFDNYENWDFTLNAPQGCFPAHWWKSPYGVKMATFFFDRLIACNLLN